MRYCKNCSQITFKSWRGWPLLKNIGTLSETVPELPKISIGSSCQICWGSVSINSEDIRWQSCNSEFSTGLPDYWILLTNYVGKDWGRPYAYEAACLRCSKIGVVSFINYPNGTKEWAINCVKCGLIKSKQPFKNMESL
jgi:hypothetical protein